MNIRERPEGAIEKVGWCCGMLKGGLLFVVRSSKVCLIRLKTEKATICAWMYRKIANYIHFIICKSRAAVDGF